MIAIALIVGIVLFTCASLRLLLSGPICYRCQIKRATMELGDYPLCRECWDWLQAKKAQLDAIGGSDLAEGVIDEWCREHPKERRP